MSLSVVRVSSRRDVWLVTAVSLLAGLLVSGVLVWRGSYAAFSSITSNDANSWQTGTVVLSDDDGATALFTVNDLSPGDGGSRCIAVTSTGNLPAAVRIYATGFAQTNGLAESLGITITQGTGAGADCSAFTPLGSGSVVMAETLLRGFAETYTSYASGVGSWTTAGTPPETRVFKIEYHFDPDAPQSTQGGSATVGFTWEAQNT